MDKVKNPYVPGAGTAPPELTGREEILSNAKVMLARIREGRPTKSMMLVGLRGVGKTVLLNKIEELAIAAGYETKLLEVVENKSLAALITPALRQLLLRLDRMAKVNAKVKRALGVLTSFARAVKVKVGEVELALDIDPEPGVADAGDLELDLPELFTAVAEAAEARGIAIAIVIDELQYLNEEEFGALIMAMHRIAQKSLPLVLVGAGLPQLVGLAGKSKSYAERLFDYPEVGPLKPVDARRALEKPAKDEGVEYVPAALDQIVKVTQGYPYFLQEWGYHTWNTAEASPITSKVADRANTLAIERLDQSFFRVRFDRLTPREKEYLRAMAELGPGAHRSGDIAEILGIAVQSAAPLRNGLIRKGMIYSPAHGDTAFTVPLFDEFMKRIMPRRRRR